MTLTRTKSGLQNLHIFKGVDLIVYTEGGDQGTLTKEDVLAGAGHKKSVDIRFWSKVFAQFLPDQSVKIMAVGSCSTLEQLAIEIADGNLHNVCVAMDRDYSNFWRGNVEHPRVIQTRTYSWENELFETDIIFRAFEKIALDAFEEPAVRQSIEDTRVSLISQMKHFLRADMILVAANQSLFCRDKPASCFKHFTRQTTPPEIDKPRLRKQLQMRKSDCKGFRLLVRPDAVVLNVARDVFGKPLLVAAVRILQYLIIRIGQESLKNDYLEKFLLDSFFDWVRDNPASDTALDYNHKLAGIAAAA